jgi:hypothetical protein
LQDNKLQKRQLHDNKSHITLVPYLRLQSKRHITLVECFGAQEFLSARHAFHQSGSPSDQRLRRTVHDAYIPNAHRPAVLQVQQVHKLLKQRDKPALTVWRSRMEGQVFLRYHGPSLHRHSNWRRCHGLVGCSSLHRVDPPWRVRQDCNLLLSSLMPQTGHTGRSTIHGAGAVLRSTPVGYAASPATPNVSYF